MSPAHTTRFVPPTVLLRISAVALTAICLVAFGESRAEANHVSCGDTITVDTTLDSDLIDCPNNGIVIGANNVTLDLNGHTIDGDGKPIDQCPRTDLCDTGVANDGYNDLTIKGGRVKQFGDGVAVFDAKGAELRQVTVSNNIDLGVLVIGARDVRLHRLNVSNNIGIGILLFETADSEVTRSTVNANGLTTDEAGMAVFESDHVKIKRNSISHNGDIGVVSSEADTLIAKRNTLADNPELGLLLVGDRNEITANRLARNGEGIAITGDDNSMTRNSIFKSGRCPQRCGFGSGITVDGGDRNLIARNRIGGSRRDGISVGLPFALHGEDNRLIGNRVSEVGRDGIRVGKKFNDTLLRRNHVSRADDDGIDARRASTTLTRNRARNNHDLGIKTVEGVTDGGDNRARGNGDSRQCTHVACG